MADADVIDRAAFNVLLESVGGDQEFLAELLQTYFDDSPQLLRAMQAALAANNAEEFRRAAHSLKSNSKNFGAMALSELARELEEMGKSGMLEGAAERIAQTEAEYARAKAALQAFGV